MSCCVTVASEAESPIAVAVLDAFTERHTSLDFQESREQLEPPDRANPSNENPPSCPLRLEILRRDERKRIQNPGAGP